MPIGKNAKSKTYANSIKNVVLLPFKCSPFSGQKDSFYKAKGPHLQAKRTTFEKQVKSFIIKEGVFKGIE